MSLLGFITGAASLFQPAGGGGTTQNQNSNTSSEQNQASQANESKTGSTTQNSTINGTTQSGTVGNTQSGTVGSQTSNTTGVTTNYSSNVLASLDAILGQQLGNGLPGTGNVAGATDALSTRLQQIQALASKPAFDVNGYVSGVTQAAEVTEQSNLDSRINGMLSATGSSEGGNSMAALLGNRLRNESAANIAGIKANATLTGEQILNAEQQGITQQIGSLSGDIMTNLTNLLAAAKGGAQTSTGASVAGSNQATTTNQNQATTQTQNTQQNVQQTEKTNTSQTGVTAGTGESATSYTGSTTPNNDIFSNILAAFGKSAAAA